MSEKIESMVTMSLKEYTDMIVQLHDLKGIVAGYKRKITEAVRKEVRENQIEAIKTATECEMKLTLSDDKLINEFSSGYSWRWESIAEDNFNILSESQVKDCAVVLIKKALAARLKDLRDEEASTE